MINNIEDLSEEEISNFCDICSDMVNKYFNVVDGESMIDVIIDQHSVNKIFKLLKSEK